MLREQILARVARHTPTPGRFETPFEGVELFRVEAPVPCMPGVYRPGFCIILAGEKHAHVGTARYVYNADSYLSITMPTPVQAEVPHASPEAPLLGLLVYLDTSVVSRLVLDIQAATGPQAIPQGRSTCGLGVARRDVRFDDALARLLALLDDPPGAQVLGAARLRELMYAALQGPGGDRLRRDFGSAPALANTLAYMHAHLDEELSIDALAQRTGMSRAAFDRHFRAATASSPLQYIKTLRLSEASMRIANGMGIGDAATGVGYHSPSQFSREFRRHFGASPRQWAQQMGV